jgi:competence protein ComEA
MKFLADLQHRFGFTRNEVTVILFLCLTLLAGMGIRWLRAGEGSTEVNQPAFDYARPDSEFIARSQAVPDDSSSVSSSHTSRQLNTRTLPPPHSLDLNTATKGELVSLPGIGESLADRIISYRNENGSFTSPNDLLRVRGIGPHKLDKIRPFLLQSPVD